MLRGEHYGTAVDVFSFAIVMSEVLALEERFTELKDGNGRVNWDVVLDMMKKRDLRPRLPGRSACCGVRLLCFDVLAGVGVLLTKWISTAPRIPDELERSMRALIEECWAPDPEARPNCNAIAFRLGAMLKEEKESAASFSVDTQATDSALLLGRSIVELLWEIDGTGDVDEEYASGLVCESLTASAPGDPILDAYLHNVRGPKCLQKLSEVMFFRETRAVAFVPEPFVDKNIHLSPDKTNVSS